MSNVIQTIPPECAVASTKQKENSNGGARIAVIWIDWYSYHIARFRAIARHPAFEGRAAGIELVGGAGVHRGLVFRSNQREDLPIKTLFPDLAWFEIDQHRIARRLWAELDRLDPEVILVPGYYTIPAFAAIAWVLRHKRRSILMSESTHQDHARKSYLERAKRTALPRLFDAAIGGGQRQVAYLQDLGFASNRIARLYNVVDNDYFAQGTTEWRRRGSSRSAKLSSEYFLYVGRLSPEKNVDGLLDAFMQYRRLGGSWSLVLVGDGPLASSLRMRVVESNFGDCVHFAGMKDTRDILPYYAYAQGLILPSWREPWGLVVNEAMSAGLPVIVSYRCGCSDDLVEDGANGFRFDPAEEGSLAKRMFTLAGFDETTRLRMGQKSKEIISRYSPRLWAEEVVSIADIQPIAGCIAT